MSSINIGESLHEGRFVAEVIRLARLTDEAWLWKLAHASGRPRPTLAQVDAAFTGVYTLVRTEERQVFPVSMIHQASRFHWFRCQSTRVGAEIERLVEGLPDLTPGEMAFLCEMMRRPRADYARHVPAILEACWRTRIYHLQTSATDMVQPWGATLEGADRERTIGLLNSYLTDKHVMLNTFIFDVLDSFGEIEATVTVDDVGRQIDAVLSDPDDGEARKWAYSTVTDIIDGFNTQVYYEAVHSLPKEAFARLITMAALGADNSFFSDWILGTLLKADHPIALPAFLRWSTPPKQGDSHPQNSVASYVRALAGCARYLKEPPTTNAEGSSDRQAWALYGQIIFWLLVPGVTNEELAARCEPLWCRLRSEYPFEAVDPLYQLQHASVVDSEQTASVLGRMWEVYPDEGRGILEFGLKHLDKLSTLLSRFRETELTEFVIHSLGLIGNRGSAKFIEPFCDSPKLGRVAVEALRKIKAAS